MLGRTKHRKATIAALMGKTSVGNNVFEARLNPYKIKDLPAINVSTERETAELLSMMPPTYRKTLSIEIDVAVSTNKGWADAIDRIVEEVLGILLTNHAWLCEFRKAELKSVTNYFSGNETDMPTAVATIAIDVEYDESFEPKIDTEGFSLGELTAINIDGGLSGMTISMGNK